MCTIWLAGWLAGGPRPGPPFSNTVCLTFGVDGGGYGLVDSWIWRLWWLEKVWTHKEFNNLLLVVTEFRRLYMALISESVRILSKTQHWDPLKWAHSCSECSHLTLAIDFIIDFGHRERLHWPSGDGFIDKAFFRVWLTILHSLHLLILFPSSLSNFYYGVANCFFTITV